jgi:DedD protein
MSLFSLFCKNKPDSDIEDSTYLARTEAASNTQRSSRRKSASTNMGTSSREGGSPIDPVLPEKKRARRRLVGAVALVLAVIIGVPMLLDSEPKPLPDDLTIEIPSKVQSGSPAVPVAKKPDATSEYPVSSSDGLGQKEEIIEPASKAEQKATPPAELIGGPAKENRALQALPQATKQDTKPAQSSATLETSPATVEVVVKKKPESAPPSRLPHGADDARAKAILEDSPVPSPKSGKFTVQVAALASADKANELQARLKNAGIASYTEKIHTDSGERIRVRIGPMSNREDAEKQRIRLSTLGLTGTVVPSVR